MLDSIIFQSVSIHSDAPEAGIAENIKSRCCLSHLEQFRNRKLLNCVTFQKIQKEISNSTRVLANKKNNQQKPPILHFQFLCFQERPLFVFLVGKIQYRFFCHPLPFKNKCAPFCPPSFPHFQRPSHQETLKGTTSKAICEEEPKATPNDRSILFFSATSTCFEAKIPRKMTCCCRQSCLFFSENDGIRSDPYVHG